MGLTELSPACVTSPGSDAGVPAMAIADSSHGRVGVMPAVVGVAVMPGAAGTEVPAMESPGPEGAGVGVGAVFLRPRVAEK